MATFVSDTFTDTADTTLASHTGETGATWTASPNATTPFLVTDANRIRTSVSTRVEYRSSGTPASAEYDVQATIRQLSSDAGQYLGVLGRLVTANDDSYAAVYSKPDGVWLLYKRVGGAFTSLGTSAATLTTGVDYVIKLEIRNATKKLFVDGVERVSSADNALTAAGFAGVVGIGFAASNTTGMHLDTFTADDPAGGATPSPAAGTLALTGTGSILGFAILMPDEA